VSYSSKRTIVSMVAGLALVIAYAIYALGSHAPASGDLQAWAVAMLVFIGVSVVVMIVIQILFHIAFAIGIAITEQEHDDRKIGRIIASSTVEDEREKLISLKSSHIAYICAGIGIVATLVALAIELPTAGALHILFGACAAGSFVEGCVGVYLHERGVSNG